MNLSKLIRVPLLISIVAAFGCTATEDNDTTSTFLIASLTNPQDEISSDVCTVSGLGCQLDPDTVQVTFDAQLKDQGRETSTVNDIVLDRYRVTYVRADGRNTPGVDVPFPFDGVVQLRVPVGGSATTALVVVRRQAKAESPLRELARGGNVLIISTIAEIDFFGRDIAGREITTRARVNVTFGDFVDTTSN